MLSVRNSTVSLLATLALCGCQTTEQILDQADDSTAESESYYVFAWGELPAESAKPRGGTSRGTEVELAGPRSLPLAEIAAADSKFEKDRAAILSLAGDYKASFHFLETMGLFTEHDPARPYHSWATEQVRILENEAEFISLQHTLVMYFKQEDGTIAGPMVMKHWRQDWTYQDSDIHRFRGKGTWERQSLPDKSVAGTWSQSVWQVDDSPRYEAIGTWHHDGNRSMWTGQSSWRPLPRREYSIRNDYDIMEGFHRIVITPTGWLHEQNNWKRVAGDSSDTPEYRGHEIGIDRYELITSPSLSKADEYWEKTAPYWEAVRQAWREVYAEHDRFSLHSKVEGKSQFEHHFGYAAKLNDGEEWNQEAGYTFAKETIQSYLAETAEETDY